ncbi:hypothetical protein JCM3774_002834 [Rhodotorula dairenensis]
MSAPAPWHLTGQGWIIPLRTPFSATPVPIPPAAYAPLERGSTADQSHRFHGGVGFVMLVRYKTSNVGPYDELIYVPGLFSRRPRQTRTDATTAEPVEYFPSITRIYVSTDESVYNGRKNWGIPKHRADFNFSSDPADPASTSVRVSLPPPDPASSISPFFACRLRNSALTPFCVPVATTWLDSVLAQKLTRNYEPALLQPPLPAAEAAKVSVQGATSHANGAETASATTYLVKPVSKGWARLARIDPLSQEHTGTHLPGYGDGDAFPQFQPWFQRFNFYLPEFEMQFPIPLEGVD